MTNPPKAKPCKVCKEPFTPQRMGQKACGVACAIAIGRNLTARANAKHAADESLVDRAKRQALKTHADLTREAQAAFNAYIRARDADQPCISCGRHHGGQWHAGHYLSTGARPELRFEPLNVHKQCQPCNTHLHGNLVLYRVNLIERIGLARVEWLEGPHDTRESTRAELVEIKRHYRAMARNFTKQTAESA